VTIRRRRAFTLIELLVVIAIIAILAAMLFPVFARARESARKIQCLSNVKNIAMAIQMYLTDFDRLPPEEHRPEVLQVFHDRGGGGTCTCCYARRANPYTKWPVVFDEYIKNRDVWRCPSSHFYTGAGAICPGPDWWAVTLAHESEWGCYGTICHGTFPPGWGGDITDSWTQKSCGIDRVNGPKSTGVFEQGIGTSEDYDLKMSQVEDPAKHWAVGDVGVEGTTWDASRAAYPDLCKLRCADCAGMKNVNWEGCPSSQNCGAGDPALANDPEWRKKFARHLGGVNAGFLDGHAAWMPSEAVLWGTTVDPRRFAKMPSYPNLDPSQIAITGGLRLCGMAPYSGTP